MAKRKCKGGVCSMIGRPKARTPSGPIAQARQTGLQGLTQQLQPTPQPMPISSLQVPGLTPNIRYTPQAAAQVAAQQAAMQNPVSALPSPNAPLAQNLDQGLQQPEDEVGELLNAVNSLTPDQKQQFYASNPEISQFLQPTTGYGQYSNQFPGAQPWQGIPNIGQQQSANSMQAMNNPQQQAKKKSWLAKAWSWLNPFGFAKHIYKAVGGGKGEAPQGGGAPEPQAQYDANGMPIPTAGTTTQAGSQVLSPSGRQPGWFEKALTGGYPEAYKVTQYTPYQRAAQDYITYNALNKLGGGGFDFGPVANQQLEQFYGNTVPTLAERFTAMGNGQRSSAFQGALANAGRGLSNDLAAQQQVYNLQQQGHYANLLNFGLRPQFENAIQPGSQGFLQAAAPAAGAVAKALI